MCDRWQAVSECCTGPGRALLTQLLAGSLDKQGSHGLPGTQVHTNILDKAESGSRG